MVSDQMISVIEHAGTGDVERVVPVTGRSAGLGDELGAVEDAQPQPPRRNRL